MPQPARATLMLKNLRTMLHTAYVLICEYQGPVVADKLLAQEAVPQAKLFAPKALYSK